MWHGNPLGQYRKFDDGIGVVKGTVAQVKTSRIPGGKGEIWRTMFSQCCLLESTHVTITPLVHRSTLDKKEKKRQMKE